MRRQFIKTVTSIFENDKNIALLLGDIGVFGFRELFNKYPERVKNVGILEQAMIGMASGLSTEGITPIVHTIAPFLVERAYEQLKLDFGYQHLNGNFVSIGASYDYASLGSTHHCPADVNILKQIPNMEIVVAGNGDEFDKLFRQSYNNGNPTYYRLSDYSNNIGRSVEFGKAQVIRKGYDATIIVVGNMLDKVLDVCFGKNVTILYYTTITPFDYEALKNNCPSDKILLCEPYYYGGLTTEIMSCLQKPIQIEYVGIPHKFITHYGTKEQNDVNLGITTEHIKYKLESLVNL